MLRLARPEDVPAVAGVQVRSWQAIYRGHFPDAFLDALSVEARTQTWKRVLSERPLDLAVLDAGAGIVGFLALEVARDGDAGPQVGEITALYLDPAVWRQGLGSRLLDWAKATARTREWKRVTLWVLAGNAQARGFYEAAGFRPDGSTRIETIGGAAAAEVRYAYDTRQEDSR